MSVRADEQRLSVGTVVSLYTLDASMAGGRVYRFVPGPFNGALVRYDGLVYTPMPISIEGIKYGGQGAVARPTLTISAINRAVVATLLGADNLRGATLTRLRTLSRYLDGEPAAGLLLHII